MAIILHPFSHAHLPELTDLWVETWQATMPQIDFAARRGWFVDHLTGMLARDVRALLAFDDMTGAMQGFVTIDPATGWLDQIAVSPQATGTGAARILIDAAKALSPSGVALDVNLDNPRALRFYEREGFQRGVVSTNARGLRVVAMHWQPAAPQA